MFPAKLRRLIRSRMLRSLGVRGLVLIEALFRRVQTAHVEDKKPPSRVEEAEGWKKRSVRRRMLFLVGRCLANTTQGKKRGSHRQKPKSREIRVIGTWGEVTYDSIPNAKVKRKWGRRWLLQKKRTAGMTALTRPIVRTDLGPRYDYVPGVPVHVPRKLHFLRPGEAAVTKGSTSAEHEGGRNPLSMTASSSHTFLRPGTLGPLKPVVEPPATGVSLLAIDAENRRKDAARRREKKALPSTKKSGWSGLGGRPCPVCGRTAHTGSCRTGAV